MINLPLSRPETLILQRRKNARVEVYQIEQQIHNTITCHIRFVPAGLTSYDATITLTGVERVLGPINQKKKTFIHHSGSQFKFLKTGATKASLIPAF
ncbi:hypothetical protein PGTUg99_020818 [Puccinia graminis f. sp. tritici]|uniref:Uncharacterized protein n=1 Tax=Puccinia graminis f. sp. tritici TaxID=56615 RepID=A0A5B0RLH2_PUCGR|nr:hypothetical protein PGTUg99_020818 [Puccinia graminis f. sp. tritici]